MNGSTERSAELDAVQREWWLYLLFGVALMVLGLAAIAVPFATAVAAATVLGLLFMAGAIVQGMYTFRMRGRTSRMVLHIVMAILYVLAGLILLAHPIATALMLTMLLAIVFFVEGVVKIVASIEMRGMPHRGWLLVGGVLSLLLGVLIASRWPASAIWAIGILVGIDLIYAGATMIALSLAVHGVFPHAPRLAGEH